MYINIHCQREDENTYASIKVDEELIEKCKKLDSIFEGDDSITDVGLKAGIEWYEGEIYDDESVHVINWNGEPVPREEVNPFDYSDMPLSLSRDKPSDPGYAISNSRFSIDKRGFVAITGQGKYDGETFESETVPTEIFLRAIEILNECDPQSDMDMV